jgi:galactokinase
MSTSSSSPANVAAGFRTRFGAEPTRQVRAPGRVNLIGEHTDYNGGFVLPMAIDREVTIALRPRGDRRVLIASLDLNEVAEIDLDGLALAHRDPNGGWREYLKGVAWALTEAGYRLGGFEACMGGNVPRGAGLSSSAAVELAAAKAFSLASGFEWEPAIVARACQRAENDWLGVSTGIMDQLASAYGREAHALLIDCRSLEVRPVHMPTATTVLILDTSTRRGLVGSAYNERREQCQAAAEHLGVAELRDVDLETLERLAPRLDPLILKRARHVVSENDRTLAAAAAMERDDPEDMGRLMNASHESLRFDFEVSSPALDAIVAVARSQPGCYGARLTGAGFGGCAVALVRADSAEAIASEVARRYQSETGHVATVYACRAAAGAGELVLPDAG